MNRRAFLGGAGAFAAGFLIPQWAGGGFALAQRGRSFSRVVADTAPLAARGASGAAAIIRARLQASLQKEFAGRVGRGPVLTARVHTVMLSGFTGGDDDVGSSQSDYLEGEIVVGAERIPILVTAPSDAAGTWYLPDFEQRRLRGLADSFASWAARRV